MEQARAVTASFVQDLVTLTVNLSGGGQGTVTSAPVGVQCPSGCVAGFARGTQVVLTAAPGQGATFAGWGGACSGSAGCTVAMSTDRIVSADFQPVLAPVQVQREGDGAADGVVLGASGAISCPSACATNLAVGTTVTLDASTSINTTVFSAWTAGPCQGQGAHCTYVVAEGQAANRARFSVNRLTVTRAGEPGRVTSNVGGVDCGTACSAVYPVGTQVTLTATPETADQRFGSWSGDCAGAVGTCVLTMGGPKTVGAGFVAYSPVVNGQAADLVLGQPNFVSGTANNGGQSLSSLNAARTCFTDGSYLWVADAGNARVLQWNALPVQPYMQPASVVIGQASPTSSTPQVGQSTLNTILGGIVRTPWGGLYVADRAAHRLMYWSAPPTSHGAPAQAVIGQATFTVSLNGTAVNRLYQPIDLTIAGSRLVVLDSQNHRLIWYNQAPVSTGLVDANAVLGQADFDSRIAAATPTASSFVGAWAVAYDPTLDRLLVADTNSHRILGWNGFPGSPRAADFVLGQTDFGSGGTNAGQSGPNPIGMNQPKGLVIHNGSLFVSDTGNNRVMVWTHVPSSTAEPAQAVLGQADLNSNAATLSASGLQTPLGLCATGNSLFVVDYSHSRVVRFSLAP